MRAQLENGVSVEEGAKTHIYLAASSKISAETGGNFENCIDISKGLRKGKYLLAGLSLGKKMHSALWEATENFIADLDAKFSTQEL